MHQLNSIESIEFHGVVKITKMLSAGRTVDDFTGKLSHIPSLTDFRNKTSNSNKIGYKNKPNKSANCITIKTNHIKPKKNQAWY